jgi:glycine hydroxymethyltransferase
MIDSVIASILDQEQDRQKNTFELIASENFASDAVMGLCGSVFTNKYAEGYPGRRYYNGCEFMDQIEEYAIAQVCKLYECGYANVQPHSGANANTAVYQAFLKPGDTILGMDLASGGHLSHGAKVNMSGKVYNSVAYSVDKDGYLNHNQVRELALAHRPKMIVAGASAYPRQVDWAAFRSIADEVDAYLLVDMAHYSGLIAGGSYDSPIPYADVVTSTTHKTLRGPRGGMILWNDPAYTKRINSAVFPGTQGGPLMNIIAAKAQCYTEALAPSFGEYADAVIRHAKALSYELHRLGVPTVTMGTDSHIVLVDLREHGVSGKYVADWLEENEITVNKNGVPNDPRPFTETSGIRIGTAAETTRLGNRADDKFREIAQNIAEVINGTNT